MSVVVLPRNAGANAFTEAQSKLRFLILRYSMRGSEFWNTLGWGLGSGYTGVGWNLQVREDREYWYLGVGILEAVQHATASP
jgi:hypothetical protein